MQFVLKGGAEIIWRIETDSDSALKIVTAPIMFEKIEHAYSFKEALSMLLVKSISPISGVVGPYIKTYSAPIQIPALTLDEWTSRIENDLPILVESVYKQEVYLLNIAFSDWDTVGRQLRTENIDEGTDINAAKLQHINNAGQWEQYINQTVISCIRKGWGQKYISYINMPMSIEGYFLFLLHKRLPDSEIAIKELANNPDQLGKPLEQAAIVISTWFWRSSLMSVCQLYGKQIWGENSFNKMLAAAIRNKATREQLKYLALLYITTEKLLCGALGSLSEAEQLAFLRIVESESLMPVKIGDDTMTYAQKIMAAGIEEPQWLKYHRLLKNLTGLWFKSALRDVLAKEDVTPDTGISVDVFCHQMAGVITVDPWQTTFEKNMGVLVNIEGLNEVYKNEFKILNWDQLYLAINKVGVALSKMLTSTNKVFVLPVKESRPVLGYPHVNQYWEGRYDTMVEAIPGDGKKPSDWWKYLVEHRFN